MLHSINAEQGVDMTFGQPTADNRTDLWTSVRVAGVEYLRLPLHTRWLSATDDLVVALKESLKHARPGDTVGVSEKVVILLTGRTVDIGTMQPGRFAQFLSAHVRPRTDSKGLAVPEKMEYVVRTVGLRRIVPAAIGSALTRPFGMHGTFYRLAGSVARDVDGGRPPYEHVLFPPLNAKVAQKICADLEQALDIGVSIVDLNDYGGSIRAVSPRSLSEETLAAVLSDNPLGQRLTSTPFVLVRPA
jgi:F420-0:gamma-glutamyl ligase